MYEVRMTDDALRAYQRADGPLARRLNRCFAALAIDPHHHSAIKRLTGDLRGQWRYRVGDWRVVYRFEGPRQVTILLIEHRRSVYGP
jgi:mRNA interferase RelE/StbE